MTRLIDADALKKEFSEGAFTSRGVREIIDNTPTVDAYPFEQVQELVKLNQQFAQEIENLKRPKGKWKVIGVRNTLWHVLCPECNCDMFTEFTSYCPNCGEPKKEINIAELTFKEADR